MDMEKSMSDELYYRGSCSYEMAVKNRLDQLERSGERNATAMLNGVRNMEYGIRSELRKSTYSIVASQELLAETFQQGFDSVNNTLSFGFARINDSITAMTEVICDKLDKIHDILNNPRLTAARELYRRAATNFEKGYFEEALEDCLQAVEKEKTDYFSWYLLGNIYLYGAGKFSNTIDLPKAEDAFFNAAKYIDADIGSSDEAKEFASQIYYGLGHTKLIMSNDLLVDNKLEESQKKLEESEKAFDESLSLDGDNVKAGYDYAKVLHFLEKDDKVLELVDYVIGIDEKTSVVFVNDKNFESLWNQIEEIITIQKIKKVDKFKLVIKEQIEVDTRKVENDEFHDKIVNLKYQSEKEIDKYKTIDFLSLYHNESKIKQKYHGLCEEICKEYDCWKEKKDQEEEERIQNEKKQKKNLELLEIYNYLLKTMILLFKSGGGHRVLWGYDELQECINCGDEYVHGFLMFSILPPKRNGKGFTCFIKEGDLKVKKRSGSDSFDVWWPGKIIRNFSMLREAEYPLPAFVDHKLRFNGKLENIVSVGKSIGYNEIISTVKKYEEERNKFLKRFLVLGCFITTATCQSRHLPDNCHELETLRKFRDTFMRKNPEMEAEVEEYYQIAPVICENISRQKNSKEIYDSIWGDYLKSAVSAVDNGENQKAHDIYKKMVLDLKEKWF